MTRRVSPAVGMSLLVGLPLVCGTAGGCGSQARSELVERQFAAVTGAGDSSVDDVARIQAYLDGKYYADVEVRHSFHTKFGEKIDCIDFDAQRSVRGFRNDGSTIDPTQLPVGPAVASDVPPAIVPPGVAFDGTPDSDGIPRHCPVGTVPTSKPTIAEIQGAGGLDQYLADQRARPPLCANTCTGQQSCFEHDCFLNQGQPPSTFEHASGIQTSFSSSPYGMVTFMPVYLPTIANGSEHSVSQFWMQTGQCENWYNTYGGPQQCPTGNGVQNQAVQSMEAGWIVEGSNPSYAKLVIFFTADGYDTYCFAGRGGNCCPTGIADAGPDQQGTDCWVEAPGAAYMPDEALEVSNLGSVTSEISVQVWNGAAHNPPYYGWFVYVNGGLIGW